MHVAMAGNRSHGSKLMTDIKSAVSGFKVSVTEVAHSHIIACLAAFTVPATSEGV